MTHSLRFRRGTAAEWIARNPVLALGEPGYDISSKRFKIGDGVSRWTTLEYYVPGAGSPGVDELQFLEHIHSEAPHPTYDDCPSLYLLYENAKV